MGVHTGGGGGVPGPGAAHGARYLGLPLVRCARLLATAHGGQTVLSEAVAVLVRDALRWAPPCATWGSTAEGPAAPGAGGPALHPTSPRTSRPCGRWTPGPHNLPLQLTSFVGRERELGEVAALLGAHRLVTLTGPGGTGKTRLALQAAADALEASPDGVWLAELGALADPALVPQAVAAAVGVREEPGRPLLATLTDALRPKRLLLVLDNCEHLLDACAGLADALLRACPHVRLLGTSREALGIAGEVPYRVPSLALPGAPPAARRGRWRRPRRSGSSPSGRWSVQPGFAVTARTPGGGGGVRPPGRHPPGPGAGGGPGAGPAGRAAPGPPGGPLPAPDRGCAHGPGAPPDPAGRGRLELRPPHRPRAAAVRPARGVRRGLHAGGGGGGLRRRGGRGGRRARPADPAGGPVAGGGRRAARRDGPVPPAGDAAPVRPAAARRGRGGRRPAGPRRVLPGAGGAGGAGAGGAAAAGVGRPAGGGAREPPAGAALEPGGGGGAESASAESAETGLRLAAALRPFWRFRGRHREGRAWLEAALALPGEAARTPTRAEALCAAGSLAAVLGDGAAAHARLEASVALWRELGDARGLGRALAQLAFATAPRDAPAARALVEEAVALARAAGDRPGLAVALRFLGNVEAPRRAAPAGPAPLEESAALFRELGDARGLGAALTGLGVRRSGRATKRRRAPTWRRPWCCRRTADDQLGVAVVLTNLGALARSQGEHRRAAELLEEGRALAQDLGYTATVAHALAELGHTALAAGDAPRAAALLTESLRLTRAHGAVWLRVRALTGLAACAAARGQARRALRLGAAAAALGETTGRTLHPADQAALDGGLAPARQALPAAAQAAAWAEGQTLPLEEAVADALEEPRT